MRTASALRSFTGSKNKAWQSSNRSRWRLLSDTEEYGQLSLTERVSKRSAPVGDLLRIGDLWNEQTKEAFSRLTRTKNKLNARDHAAGKDRVATCVDVPDEEVRYKEPIHFHIE